MKKTFNKTIVMFVILCPMFCFSQQDSAKKIFTEFENCLSVYFKKEFKKLDSSFVFFYGNKYNSHSEIISLNRGADNYINFNYYNSLDSISKDTLIEHFLFRGMSFQDFINYLLDFRKPSNKQCYLRMASGIFIFIDCPDESWQHFFLDKLIYKDDWYLNPIVDIFVYKENKILHSRYLLTCVYKKSKGFEVGQKYIIRNLSEVCNFQIRKQ